MPSKPNLAVVDSSVFLAVLNKENDNERLQRSIELLFPDSQADISLLAPAIVPLEIASVVARSFHQFPDRRREVIGEAETWFSGLSSVLLAECSRRVIECAQRVVEFAPVKPADALIVGTALAYGAGTVYTWDEKLVRHCDGLPDVHVALPPQPTRLPV